MAKNLSTLKILADNRRTPTYIADSAEPVVMAPIGPNSLVHYDFDFSDLVDALKGDTIAAILAESDAELKIGDGATAMTPAIGSATTPPAPVEIDPDSGIVRIWVWVDTTIAVLDSEYTITVTVRTDGTDPTLEPRSIKVMYADR